MPEVLAVRLPALSLRAGFLPAVGLLGGFLPVAMVFVSRMPVRALVYQLVSSS